MPPFLHSVGRMGLLNPLCVDFFPFSTAWGGTSWQIRWTGCEPHVISRFCESVCLCLNFLVGRNVPFHSYKQIISLTPESGICSPVTHSVTNLALLGIVVCEQHGHFTSRKSSTSPTLNLIWIQYKDNYTGEPENFICCSEHRDFNFLGYLTFKPKAES